MVGTSHDIGKDHLWNYLDLCRGVLWNMGYACVLDSTLNSKERISGLGTKVLKPGEAMRIRND